LTAARLQKLKACLDRRQPALTVLTDNVHKPHNVSAIMRTCDAVGVFSLHAVLKDDAAFRARSGIAMGSDKWLDLHLHSDTGNACEQLKADGFSIAAVHKSERSVNFRDIDYTGKLALLFGAELFGVSESAAAEADQHIVIPMLGMVESYNVSVAAAIVLLEAQRQLEAAGRYECVQLDQQTYQRTLFRWYRPSEAKWCDRHDVVYPQIDDDGELCDPAGFERLRNLVSN